MIQGHLILKHFRKICFQRNMKKKQVVLSFQSVVLHLEAFERVCNNLALVDFAV